MNTSMKPFPKPFFALLACALATTLAAAADVKTPEHWETIFDGKTLQGWIGNMDDWRVQDGAIVGEIPAGKSLSKNEFIYWDAGVLADFELSVEYRISGLPSANSGIQIRSERQNAVEWQAKGYQADLDDGAVWLGRVYEEEGRGMIAERGTRVSIAPDGRRWVDPFPFATAASFKAVPKKEDWNTYEVKAAGPHIETRVNGRLFTVLDDHQLNAAKYSGKLAFQLHAGQGPSKIEFRNIRVKHLGHTDLPTAPGDGKGGGGDTALAVTPAPAAVAAIQPLGANGKALNLNFETGTLEGWKAEGNAWEGQPIKNDTVSPRKPGERSNHTGEYWIGGYEKIGDGGTGKLTSEPFEVTHPWASFLVGGGSSPETRVEIVADGSGEIIQKTSGKDAETMARAAVDLRKWKGKHIFVRLVDERKDGWGHVNFDDFVFHDSPPAAALPGAVVKTGRQNDSPVLWHLRPNPAQPSTPPVKGSGADVAAGMLLTNGFQAELIAEEPALKQPIAFTFDERGRLWVAEAMCYPTKQPEGKGKDRILIFEDTTGNGKFDKRTVFIEGLNLVSALEVGYGGVWVGAAPQLLFIPDRNHDDVPDGPPEVLLDGFGYNDTHETLNSFTWGPDGWLYGNQGVFNTAMVGKPDGAQKSPRTELHAGVWRYHPLRHEFEIFASGGSNQWGLDFNTSGHLFMTHCRSFFGGGGTSYVIRNGHYWNQANSGYAPFISNQAPPNFPNLKNYLPASAKTDDGEGGAGKPGTTAIYGGHSHVGTMVYLGDNWPDIYRNQIFTHNLFGHQMNHNENVREGSGYETMQGGYDMLYVPDPTYVAINLKYGPDGAVYIIDWCDKQHCHTPRDDAWDRTNGRIYRVSWAQTYKPVKVDLGKMSDLELAALQTHKNDWYARIARRLLTERAQTAAIAPEAVTMLAGMAAQSAAEEAAVLRGLWTLYGIGTLNDARLTAAMHHESETVRAWAIQLATENGNIAIPGERLDALAAMAETDKSAMVRVALASTLPVLDDAARWRVGEALAMHGEDAEDRFLPKMIWFGLGRLMEKDPARALALAAKTPLPSLADSIDWYAGRNPSSRETISESIVKSGDDAALRLARLLSFSLSEQNSAAMPKEWPAAAARLQAHSNAEAHALSEQLSAVFGDKASLVKMRQVLADEKMPLPERRRAFDLLKRSGDAESSKVFAGLLDSNDFRTQVIPLLARSDDTSAATALLQRYATFNEADRAAALNVLSSRAALSAVLLQAIEDKTFDKQNITAFHIRQMQNLNNADLKPRIEKLWGKVNELSGDFKATVARFRKAYNEAPLWAYDTGAGKKVFDRTCATCHALNGVGGKLGPDLAGSWRNGLDYFLENIVDPSAVVGENYRLNLVKKNDGTVVSGMFEKDTGEALLFRTVTETISVPKAEIKQRQVLQQSFMPEGLLEAMPQREVIELMKFLTSKR